MVNIVDESKGHSFKANMDTPQFLACRLSPQDFSQILAGDVHEPLLISTDFRHAIKL
jgi:hypothetical protein